MTGNVQAFLAASGCPDPGRDHGGDRHPRRRTGQRHRRGATGPWRACCWTCARRSPPPRGSGTATANGCSGPAASAGRAVDDRARPAAGPGPVDVARHPGRRRRRVGHLGAGRAGVMTRRCSRPTGRTTSTRSATSPGPPGRSPGTRGRWRCCRSGPRGCGCCGSSWSWSTRSSPRTCRESGPGATVYRTTFWVAATLVLFMAMVQLGVAAFRRDGQSLARVAVGTAQFLMVWVAWLTYAVAAAGRVRGPDPGGHEGHHGGGRLVAVAAVGGVQHRRTSPTPPSPPSSGSWACSWSWPRSGTCSSCSPAPAPCSCWRRPPRSPPPGWSPTPAGPGSGSRCAGSTPPRSPPC